MLFGPSLFNLGVSSSTCNFIVISHLFSSSLSLFLCVGSVKAGRCALIVGAIAGMPGVGRPLTSGSVAGVNRKVHDAHIMAQRQEPLPKQTEDQPAATILIRLAIESA
jgi:hypothetical protein